MKRPELHLDGFDEGIARRMTQTVACPDSDDIVKVADAGADRVVDGQTVQVMHNGLLVVKGGYFSDWMAEIIRALRGHHEPQEELVFDRVVARLKEDTTAPTMIEFGSFWLYYGLWFLAALGESRVVAIEPDPAYMQVGVRNAALNGLSERVTFVDGAIGPHPGEMLEFPCQGLGDELHSMQSYDLASLMSETGLDHVDLILCDIQGAETILLDRARGDFAAGKVRFLLVSTHHNSISGHPLTHQNALVLLQEAGAHVLTEHSVSESCSGDGLIAVSFDARDKDLSIPVSHVRSKDSLFGEVEHELFTAIGQIATPRDAGIAEAAEAHHQVRVLEDERARLQTDRDAAADESDRLLKELRAITSTKAWRALRVSRQVYGRLRRS